MCFEYFAMNITVSKINFTGLVPKESYTGPILKLTKSDKAEISTCEKELTEKISAACRFKRYIENSNLSLERKRSCHNKLCDLEHDISIIREKIRSIKVARLNKQKESLRK